MHLSPCDVPLYALPRILSQDDDDEEEEEEAELADTGGYNGFPQVRLDVCSSAPVCSPLSLAASEK
jgi:hypothetical protein